ncbi:hypothetical protein LJC27_08335 [Christensenellaceae bacterium OttesenSCG-928-M15]|nr:hypothetical protein [Christensenellaceae bacterium OttesenSCG-928-M15]
MKNKWFMEMMLGFVALVTTSLLLFTVLQAELVGTAVNGLMGLVVLLAGVVTTGLFVKYTEEKLAKS